MSTPFGTTLSPQRSKTIDWLQRERTCVRCRTPYREVDNLGRHTCRAYHPLQIARDARGQYACCHRPVGAAGCVPADHTDGAGDAMAIDQSQLQLDVTGDDALVIATLLGCGMADVKRPSWTYDASHSVWRVARCSLVERAAAMHRQYDILGE